MGKENRNIISAIAGCDRRRIVDLHRKCGGNVHIFDDGCKLSVRLLPYARFHRIFEMMPETLSMYINGFADGCPDNIVAVAASDKYKNMLDAASAEIESRCIILREELDLCE